MTARKLVRKTGSGPEAATTTGAVVSHAAAPFRTAFPSVAGLRTPDMAQAAQQQKGEFGPIRRELDTDQPTRERRGAMSAQGTRQRSDAVLGQTRARSNALVSEETRARRAAPQETEELDSLANHTSKTSSKAMKVLGMDSTPDGKFSNVPSAGKRGAVAAIKAKERGADRAVHQPVADLGEIYSHTEMLEAEFKHQVMKIAEKTKGKSVFRPGGKMKSIGRTLEKIVADYKGDASRIVDLTGGSISFASAEDLIYGFGAIKSNPMFNVVRVKNSLAKGKSYGDINLSLEMGGADYTIMVDGEEQIEHHAGFIIELQLHLDPIIEAKGAAHKEYETQRKIGAKNAGTDQSNWRFQDQLEWQSLEDQMIAAYGVAWAQMGNAAEIAAKLDKAIKKMDPS